MRCDPACTTKKELLRRIEAGEAMYAFDPRATMPGSGQTEGEAVVYGPSSWSAKVELKQGQIVRVIE